MDKLFMNTKQNAKCKMQRKVGLFKNSLGFLQFALFFLLCGAAGAAVPNGYVVHVDSKTAYLDWGSASGVQVNDRFEVFRDGEVLKHPVTGEVLGRTETKAATGHVESIEPKFAIGHLDETLSDVLNGDRTRWLGTAASAAPAAETPVTTLAGTAATLTELWRSEALEKDAMGMAFSDLDGDGQKDIIVAYKTKIQAYRWKDKKLELLAAYEDRHYTHWLAIDVADLKQDGHEEIFATAFNDSAHRPRIIVLDYANGKLNRTADFEGFARSIQRKDGTRHLYWQTFSRSSELYFTSVSELRWEKGKFREGPPLDLKLFRDQLFGFTWGDWVKSGTENFAVLEHGDRIRIYAPDIKWKSSEVYGGTKADFSFDDNTIATLQPRLIDWKPAGSDRDQLIIPTNIPDLGVRLTYMKLYKRSQIDGLAWNGLDLKSAWRVAISGYLADYGVIDLMGQSKPQLWVAASGPGDKTILLSYQLP
jgi:hypothetical protein